MLKRVGFFHFVDGRADPVGSLRAAIEIKARARDVTGSLIVLPEAFNIGMNYYDEGCPDYDPCVLSLLRDIASLYRVGFVAGLVIEDGAGPTPPHSSVYYVDGDVQRLICHKHGSDNRESAVYTAFDSDDCDITNPIEQKGACIAAMLCMDIEQTERREDLVKKAASSSQPIRAFCIPAHMSPQWQRGLQRKTRLDSSLPDESLVHVVVANSNPASSPSFVLCPNGDVVDTTNRLENEVSWCSCR